MSTVTIHLPPATLAELAQAADIELRDIGPNERTGQLTIRFRWPLSPVRLLQAAEAQAANAHIELAEGLQALAAALRDSEDAVEHHDGLVFWRSYDLQVVEA